MSAETGTDVATGMGAEPASPSVLAPRCENCGALVTSRFCPDCGQRKEHATYSVWHFLREATEDLTHADSRLWLTLSALLFRPGYLTREFFDGRRARYLPPIRLYLVLSVLFFLTAGATAFVHSSPTAGAARDSPQAQTQDVYPQVRPDCSALHYEGPWSGWLQSKLVASCHEVALDHGRALEEEFAHSLPRALFVFLPLLALFMKLMYFRPRRYYVEHLLFFVHDHAAVFLLLTLSWLVDRLLPWAALGGLVKLGIGIYLPVYLYRSMRRVYQQGHWLTSLKFATLALAYLVSGAMMVAIVALYSYLVL
jgi:hypothetical protein